MAITKNTKNVPFYQLGVGAFEQLHEHVEAQRAKGGIALFYVDHFFKNSELPKRLPTQAGDQVVFVDTTAEPTVELIDMLAGQAKVALQDALPCCLVAVGGGAVMDATKAVGNMLTNPGKAAEYQGWDLVKNPAPYKIAVPTLSGTGAECSRTCVLTNMERGVKLGMNSDYTMFDQLVLDPSLTRTVPRNQYFYTGMDTFMHCFESIRGSYRNVIVDTLSTTAIEMSLDIFLGAKDMMDEENLEKMMVASYIGGMAAGNTGVVHPFSAGLSIVLHLPHGLANCYALSVLGEFYPQEYAQFTEMMAKQKVSLPKGICANLPEDKLTALYQGSVVHEKPLTNALGANFKEILTKEKVISLFKQM